MWPLLGCSILSLTFIIERVIYFTRVAYVEKVLIMNLLTLLMKGDFIAAKELCSKRTFPLAKLLNRIVERYARNLLPENIDEIESDIYFDVERFLPFLSAIAGISTLLGFTGTVTGMIRAFESIVKHGVSSPTVVAAGIAEALITTATGLFIAVPTLLFYHYFSYRADKVRFNIEQFIRRLTKCE